MARDRTTAHIDQDAVARSGRAPGLWIDRPGQVWAGSVREALLIPARTRHTLGHVARGGSRWRYGYRR